MQLCFFGLTGAYFREKAKMHFEDFSYFRIGHIPHNYHAFIEHPRLSSRTSQTKLKTPVGLH